MEIRHYKKHKLGLASPKEMRARLIAAARGEAPPVTKEAKIWMSVETLMHLLTTENRKLLEVMARDKPRSVSELAKRLGRDQGNVSRAIARLENAGVVELVQDGREKRPKMAIDRIRIDMDLVRNKLELVG